MKNKKELIILISIVVILILVAGGIIIKNIKEKHKIVETVGQAIEENLLEEPEELNEIEENKIDATVPVDENVIDENAIKESKVENEKEV